MNGELNCCPKCGSENIGTYAFSLSADAGIYCKDCDFGIEEEISWEGCEADVPEDHPEYRGRLIAAHDRKAYRILKEKWNAIKPEYKK